MSIVAQLDKDGFFLGESEDYGGPMPHCCISEFPPETELPENTRWRYVNSEYLQTEDYRDKDVYDAEGNLYRVQEYGPLPEGHGLTPPPPTFEEALTVKLAEVMSAYAAAFAPVDAIYPAAEREGWAIQEAEARAVLADPAADTPVLSALAEVRGRGETVGELANKVMVNAAQWRGVYAYLTGQQQRMYAEVKALATVEDVLAYEVAYAVSLPEFNGE